MKTSTEILKEIEKAKKNITTTAEDAYSLYYEELRQALEGMGYSKYIEMKKSEKLQALKEEYLKEIQKNTIEKIKIEILKDNYARAFFSEKINTICEIWNKYEGKPYGEKTKEKISNEIEQATGARVRVYSNYDYLHIDIHNPAIFNFWGYRGIVAASIYEKDNPRQDCLNDNKILKIDPLKIDVCYIGAYVDNASKHASEILKLHEKAKQAEQIYYSAIQQYNQATRGKIQHASRSEGVRNNIF